MPSISDVLRCDSPVAAVEVLDHRVGGVDHVEVGRSLVVRAIAAHRVEAAIVAEEPVVGGSIVGRHAAVVSKVASKLHGVVLAGSATIVRPGEGVSLLVLSGHDAHLLL